MYDFASGPQFDRTPSLTYKYIVRTGQSSHRPLIMEIVSDTL